MGLLPRHTIRCRLPTFGEQRRRSVDFETHEKRYAFHEPGNDGGSLVVGDVGRDDSIRRYRSMRACGDVVAKGAGDEPMMSSTVWVTPSRQVEKVLPGEPPACAFLANSH